MKKSNCLLWAMKMAALFGGRIEAVPSHFWLLGPHFVWIDPETNTPYEFIPKDRPTVRWMPPPMFLGEVRQYKGNRREL